jgi:redox-sensitive bicupin YhaK (pirin superfamily)
VLVGSLAGVTSAATTFSPLVGADLAVTAGTRADLPLDRDFEHAVLVTDGSVEVAGRPVARGELLYLPPGPTVLPVQAQAASRLMLLGGEPFDERIVMWWNFVGSDHDAIVTAREQWQAAHPRFGAVAGDDDRRLPAPALPQVRLTARGRTRDA